ncbi:MAG: hypothetical protein WB822_10820 [Rhodoplanes sp.]
MLDHGSGASLTLAAKVGVATGCTTMFVFFFAHYAEFRTELIRAERELNILSHGRLATTRLGQQALRESLSAAFLAADCGALGSSIPLLLGLLLPRPPIWGWQLPLCFSGSLARRSHEASSDPH